MHKQNILSLLYFAQLFYTRPVEQQQPSNDHPLESAAAQPIWICLKQSMAGHESSASQSNPGQPDNTRCNTKLGRQT